jgi:adenine/guanine phosphoribosyltransferase-like PRPP-binding protein
MSDEQSDRIIGLDDMMTAIRSRVSGEFDLVIGIERGGILPAYLAARWLDVPLKSIKDSFPG